VNLDEKKRSDGRDQQDEGKQKASDEQLGGALLLGTRAGDAEGGNEGFRELGEKLHEARSLRYFLRIKRCRRQKAIIAGSSRWRRGRR
jgi:hypothetical protein